MLTRAVPLCAQGGSRRESSSSAMGVHDWQTRRVSFNENALLSGAWARAEMLLHSRVSNVRKQCA